MKVIWTFELSNGTTGKIQPDTDGKWEALITITGGELADELANDDKVREAVMALTGEAPELVQRGGYISDEVAA